jgi:hypothetical protein
VDFEIDTKREEREAAESMAVERAHVVRDLSRNINRRMQMSNIMPEGTHRGLARPHMDSKETGQSSLANNELF